MMENLLICTPTCGRADIVEEVLRYESEYYTNYDFDIAYYDSGSDNAVKDVIENVDDTFRRRINYYRTDKNQCLDYKIVDIFKSLASDKEIKYEYIWFIGDSVSISKEALDIVSKAMDEKYDLIRLPLAGSGSEKDIICDSPQEWFERCSGSMAHMAPTVMRTTLLMEDECEWSRLCDKYICCNELCDRHGYFFTVAFYLERIIKLDSFRGIMIGNRVKWRRDSPLKGNRSYWINELFDVWARSYCETLLALPQTYKNKEQVIRQSDNIMVGRFSASMLARYRLGGIYDYRVYKKYKKYFPLVTDEPLWKCLIISAASYKLLKKLYMIKEYTEGEWDKSLEDIRRRVKGRNVIVYGAGLYGERVSGVISRTWENEIVGIAVTDKSDNMKQINGIDVYSIDELAQYRRDAFIIVATLPAAARCIVRGLRKKGFKYYEALLGC